VSNILDIIFNVIIVITMFLCFFSLCSSMSANLMEQTKELGILRAMGFTKTRIKMLYFYEAFVLVIASCLLGVMIGIIVGYTMVLQQVVFTGIPLTFFFPWAQFLLILAITIVCAFFSTWGPTGQLVKKDIAAIFRTV
jgi:ABC-type antimicrobial peptide transport system permease subunit